MVGNSEVIRNGLGKCVGTTQRLEPQSAWQFYPGTSLLARINGNSVSVVHAPREDHLNDSMLGVSLRLNSGLGIDLERARAVGTEPRVLLLCPASIVAEVTG